MSSVRARILQELRTRILGVAEIGSLVGSGEAAEDRVAVLGQGRYVVHYAASSDERPADHPDNASSGGWEVDYFEFDLLLVGVIPAAKLEAVDPDPAPDVNDVAAEFHAAVVEAVFGDDAGQLMVDGHYLCHRITVEGGGGVFYAEGGSQVPLVEMLFRVGYRTTLGNLAEVR